MARIKEALNNKLAAMGGHTDRKDIKGIMKAMAEAGGVTPKGESIADLITEMPSGGGESSTATVTVGISGATLAVPNVPEGAEFYQTIIPDDGVYKIWLYEGKGLAVISEQSSLTLDVTTSGNIEYDPNYREFLITGDGSITISRGH